MTEKVFYISDDKEFRSDIKSKVIEYENEQVKDLLRTISRMKQVILPQLSAKTRIEKLKVLKIWNCGFNLTNLMLLSSRINEYVSAVRTYKHAQTVYKSAREKLAKINENRRRER